MLKFLFLLFCVVNAQDEGERCNKDGVPGTCKNIHQCPAALEDIRNRRVPKLCGFSGLDTIVCCIESSSPPKVPTTTTPRPIIATTPPRSSTTTEYTPVVNDYVDNEGGTGECEPISPALTSKKTGRKAWDKCIEYQHNLIYPCERGVTLTGGLNRANHCMHNADELIIGGVDAANGEFPHMALLGFGDDIPTVKWLCGGSIISNRFILTAGHCTASRDDGPVTYAMIGILKRPDQVDNSKVFKLKNVIKHPQYQAPIRYNDIALLETEKEMPLGPNIVPACLHVGDEGRVDRASATGWGLTQYRGTTADILQKVVLTKFPTEECSAKFPPHRHMKQGFNATSQVCYGDATRSKDTCQGDSGGPLQIKNTKIHCMYTIIGVTSFGKACGFVGEPGIYTRVVNYVPWIESVVWPDN